MVRREHEILGEAAPDLAVAALALARRFAAGATLWCWAPGCARARAARRRRVRPPGHRGHPCPPRGGVLDDDIVAALRPMARAGDVLLVVAGADVARRCHAAAGAGLGPHHIWLGAGARPLAAGADHLLWLSDDPAGRSRRAARARLPRAVGADPRVLRAPGPPRGARGGAGRGLHHLLRRRPAGRGRRQPRRRCRRSAPPSGIETVSTLLVGPVQPGDLVLVHAGTAITVVDP